MPSTCSTPFTYTSNGRVRSAGRRTRVLVGASSGTFIEWQPVRQLFLALAGSTLVAAIVAPSALGQLAPVTPESPNAESIRDSYLFVSIFVVGIFVLVEGL